LTYTLSLHDALPILMHYDDQIHHDFMQKPP